MSDNRALLRGGSRSFYAASFLLPRQVRHHATALYAFCRLADDAIDLSADKHAALADFTARLDAAYAGTPHPDDLAFAATLKTCAIPYALPAALLEGFAWDAENRRYARFEDLLDYAARVAGAVGVMMALIMGARDATTLARAADLGTAMQLTNIARDVGEDARADRIFLPLEWLTDAGVTNLTMPSAALSCVVQRLLSEADILYMRAAGGLRRLPLACRCGIAAARRFYAAIGADIAARAYDSVTARAHVPGTRKLWLATLALADTLRAFPQTDAPALPANQFLIQHAAIAPAPVPKLVWVLDLFERLERTQREQTTRLQA
jgi:phytoene synthase